MKTSRYKSPLQDLKEKQRLDYLKSLPYAAIGFTWAEACNRIDHGDDIRRTEIPEILRKFEAAFPDK